MTIAPLLPVGPLLAAPAISHSPSLAPAGTPQSFSQFLTGGLAQVQDKIATADKTVRAFVLDDSVPVHQVSFALEQARLSLELMLQVRSRVVEGYQQLMNMQM